MNESVTSSSPQGEVPMKTSKPTIKEHAAKIGTWSKQKPAISDKKIIKFYYTMTTNQMVFAVVIIDTYLYLQRPSAIL